jgi:dTMP kinase
MITELLEKIYPTATDPSESYNPQFFVSLNGKVMVPRKSGARFIVIEGLEGSGQSTQASLLRDHLEEKGVDTLLTKEPTLISPAGEMIKKALNKEIAVPPQEFQQLFAQDRKEHLERTILPALAEGRIVISDRYFFSSFAYGSDECALEWLIDINGNFIFPDATFILSATPAVCMERIKKRDLKPQIFENKEKLTKALVMYEKVARMYDNVYLVNGEQSIEGVFYAMLNKFPV